MAIPTYTLLCALFTLAIISSKVKQSAAEASADPEPGSRYFPWSAGAVISQYEQPSFAAPIINSRIHRPYNFFNNPQIESTDEEYYNNAQSALLTAKMSRMLEMALGNLKEEAESLKGQLVHLKDEVNDLKGKLLSESSRNHHLQDQVSQLEQSLSKKKTEESSSDDYNISEYARLNGALTTALGLGRPWVKTFFSFRKTSTFSALSTPITYEITDANVGNTVTSGVFTAPRAGYYFFSFNGVTDLGIYPVNAVLIKNGGIQRTSYGSPASLSRMVLQDALILSAGDTVSVQLTIPSGQNSTTTGTLYEDGSSYYTRFLGYSIVLL